MNSNRTFIIIGIVVLLAIVGVGAYFLLSGSKTATTTVGQATGTLPNAGTQTGGTTSGSTAGNATSTSLAKSLGIISDKQVIGYAVTANNVVNMIQPDGEIDQVTNGNLAVLNSLQIQNIISAGFSYDGAKLFVNFGDPSNPQTSIFTIASKAWTPMPAGWQSPAWSPSDYRIAYMTANASHVETFSTLVVASDTKTQPTAFLSLHAQDLSLAWPAKNHIVIQTKPTVAAQGSSWLFDLGSGVLSPIGTEVAGLETAWNNIATGTPFALQFSAGSLGGGSLQLIDKSGNVTQTLKFITLPSKCNFAAAATPTSTQYLYCGVPRDQSDLAYAALPDDYNESAIYTSDDIYQINLANGMTNTLFNDPSQNFDVSDPSLVNNTFFFINRYNQELYAIQFATSTAN